MLWGDAIGHESVTPAGHMIHVSTSYDAQKLMGGLDGVMNGRCDTMGGLRPRCHVQEAGTSGARRAEGSCMHGVIRPLADFLREADVLFRPGRGRSGVVQR